MARKPLGGSTVAANVLEHGTGGLNIDGCRVESAAGRPSPRLGGGSFRFDGFTSVEQLEECAARDGVTPNGRRAVETLARYRVWQAALRTKPRTTDEGRWPANVVLTHTPCCGDECEPGCPVAELDAQSGTLTSGKAAAGGHRRVGSLDSKSDVQIAGRSDVNAGTLYGDTGGASRYFPTFRYQAKAPTSERPKVNGISHPTVKPLALLRWLTKLVTPPGGVVLDPFAGSGTTLEAAQLEGFGFYGIELDPQYLDLIFHRLAKVPAPTDDRRASAG